MIFNFNFIVKNEKNVQFLHTVQFVNGLKEDTDLVSDDHLTFANRILSTVRVNSLICNSQAVYFFSLDYFG